MSKPPLQREAISWLYREWFGRAVGVLARSVGDLDLAEEVVQDAFATALERWPRDGIPDEPGAWIIRTARNRAIDVLRRRRMAGERERQAVELEALRRAIEPERDSTIPDERLGLMFACCNPLLTTDASIALTLRLVAGLTVEEVARALLTTPPAISQRLVRSKRTLRDGRVTMDVPADHELPERLGAVLAVIYLVFNEGHSATAGEQPVRTELCAEAIRLARVLAKLMPDESEARGLLALCLATDARRAARYDAAGAYVSLEDHDRSRYDAAKAAEADELVRGTLAQGPGPYAFQAAISSLHSLAPAYAETDWAQIASLYGLLANADPSPVIALNRAIAVSLAEGPEVALPLLDALEVRLADYAPFHAARADVYRREGDAVAAREAYLRAIELTGNPGERAFLERRLGELGWKPGKALRERLRCWTGRSPGPKRSRPARPRPISDVMRLRSDIPRTAVRLVALFAALVATALSAPTAGAIIGGTDQTSDAFAAPLVFIKIVEPGGGIASCSGTLIAPAIVMTAAHCVYDTDDRGNLFGVSKPASLSVRVGSRNLTDPALGIDAGVVAVLPQPYYRWDGSRHNHDVALLALDRSMPQRPATLAEQAPAAGKSLLIAGYGSVSTNDQTVPSALKAALIDAADPASCRLASESFDPSWLFCGAASTDPDVPGGISCYGDSGGPAFAYENTVENVVVEGVISYGSRRACEYSRSYLVLVSSERGFIDHALATPPQSWSKLRDLPPMAAVRPVHRHLNKPGLLTLRVNDDKSRHSRVGITFYTHGGKRLSRAYRNVTTNSWVEFDLGSSARKFSGYICVQGTDATKKPSNIACASNVIK